MYRSVRARCLACGVLALLAITQSAQANIIINGDFENNTASGTLFNLDNGSFNATLPGLNAFGAANEIDLMTGAPYGTAPVSGDWKLGIHTQGVGGPQDGFSFSLTASVVSG